jgi:protein subunit release factor A
LTVYKLDVIMTGMLDELIDPLNTYFQAEALKGTA